MEKQITDEQLIEHLEGGNNPEIEQQLKDNAALQKRYYELKEVLDTISDSRDLDVPEHIKENVQQAIYEEQSSMQQGFSWMHIAAAVVIMILGFSMGRFTNQPEDTSSELASLKTEIQSLKEATLTSSLKRYSASDRILAVNKIESSNEINTELISTLVRTLNTDESPNVRYAALQAMTNYLDVEEVRYELVKSLEEQTDPLLQISLITVLVEAQEKSARGPMQKLIENEETLDEVKQQAEIALQVLV